MADKKISELVSITGSATAADDYFVVVDTSGAVTYKISREELNNAIEQDVLSSIEITDITNDVNVQGTVTADGLTVDGSTVVINNTGGDAQLYLGGSSGTNRMYLGRGGLDSSLWNVSNGNLSFGTNDTERMRIDNSGRVLIGGTNTAPGFGNTVTGLNLSNDGRFFASVTSESHSLNRNSTDGDIVQFRKDGTTVGSIGTFGGQLDISGTTNGIRFGGQIEPIVSRTRTNDAVDLGSSTYGFKNLYLSGGALTSTVKFLANTTVSGSDATIFRPADNTMAFSTNGAERMRILSTGGITFNGDTAAANALDDYEEGTWTPTLNYGTVSSLSTWYTKVGNLVSVGGLIYNFSDRSTGDQVIINNLPFTTGSGVTAGSVFFRHCNISGNQLSCYTASTATNIQFWSSSFAGGYTTLTHSQLNSSDARIFFGITYATA